MQQLIFHLSIFAQADGDGPSSFMVMLPMWLIIGFVFYLLLIRPQKQERARREEVLNTLKKNDRVVTIGGIIGSVADVSQEKQTVTVKVDDNTRIKFQKSAIQGLYNETGSGNDQKR